jgi:hypothetical protein
MKSIKLHKQKTEIGKKNFSWAHQIKRILPKKNNRNFSLWKFNVYMELAQNYYIGQPIHYTIDH